MVPPFEARYFSQDIAGKHSACKVQVARRLLNLLKPPRDGLNGTNALNPEESSMANPALSEPKDRTELHKKFAELGLRGYWQSDRNQPRMEPKLWRWKDIYPALMETAEVIRIGPDAFRRNVALQTGSKTLAMGFQIVLPGEAAAAHRHTNTALRFVVKGGGAYTTSNGEPMVMEPGDLLIQPNWVWHDHVNNSKEPIIWIDA